MRVGGSGRCRGVVERKEGLQVSRVGKWVEAFLRERKDYR